MSSSSGDDDASFYECEVEGNNEEDRETNQFRSYLLSDAMEPNWEPRRANLAISTSPTALSANTTATRRPRSLDGFSIRSQSRHSLPEAIPAVPAIPEHLLATGKRATLAQRRKADGTHKHSPGRLNVTPSPSLCVQRPSTSAGEEFTSSPARSPNRQASRSRHGLSNATAPPSPADHTRRKSLPALPAHVHKDTLEKLENRRQGRAVAHMNRAGKGRNEDLFLELANDRSGADDGVRPPSRSGRASSRLSFSGKRRSMPSESVLPSTADGRPSTSSGQTFGNRPSSRLGNFQSDLQRHVERYRSTPSRAAFPADDAISVSSRSRSGRPHRYSVAADNSNFPPVRVDQQVRSPELPHYGRRRPSFGATPPQPPQTRPSQLSKEQHDTYSESPAESSEPKQSLPDSASVESQTDTVWDELDDLKSRIKKLELTGKLPAMSGAAVATEANERPRTATTAPTTIDSSPKVEKQEKKPDPAPPGADTTVENTVGGTNLANIHPNLHSALAKAKPLLSAPLYRSLEATAADALQLAAMTGSAGPQGTAFSAAAIINGVTASDRHVRRKADTMCRNLTDLCLALCEGKHEAPSILSSPVSLDTSAKNSPAARFGGRSSLGPSDSLNQNGGSRPMSRLEARRTSILGSQGGSSLGNSPIASGEDLSASEQETTPSHLKVPETRRFSRPGSRLQTTRRQRYEDASGDEDPTIRSPSRAMTDIGRGKRTSPREYSTPQQQRSPSLRDSLTTRRANAAAYEGNREPSRVSSLTSESSGSRRRFLDHSTPPVLEEESNGDDYQPVVQPKRRVMSFGTHGSRRATTELPNRATSLNQRRHIVVE